MLAEKLGYSYFDLDDEVRKYYGITLEQFVNTGNLFFRDARRTEVMKKIAGLKNDKVVAVTPMTYIDGVRRLLENKKDLLVIELSDTVFHIFDRLVFSDEQDRIYKDDEYKNAHKEYYLKEIHEDLIHYGIHSFYWIENQYDMDGRSPEEVVSGLIEEYELEKKVLFI